MLQGRRRLSAAGGGRGLTARHEDSGHVCQYLGAIATSLSPASFLSLVPLLQGPGAHQVW